MRPEDIPGAMEQASQKSIAPYPVDQLRLNDLVNLVNRVSPDLFDEVHKIKMSPGDSFYRPYYHTANVGTSQMGTPTTVMWTSDGVPYQTNPETPPNVLQNLMHESIHGPMNKLDTAKQLMSLIPGKFFNFGPQDKQVPGLPNWYDPKHQSLYYEVPSNVIGYGFAKGVFPDQLVDKIYPQGFEQEANDLASLLGAINAGAVPFMGDEHPFNQLPIWQLPKSEQWQKLQR